MQRKHGHETFSAKVSENAPRQRSGVPCSTPNRLLFVRTVNGRGGDRLTVGSGIGPDLLTLHRAAKALAGSPRRAYRRWGISPRPEDAG